MRTDPRTDLRADVRADLRTDLRSQLDLEQERAFKQSKQFAQLFKIKPEATDGNFKRRRLDPSEVSEVEYRRIVGGGNLPLSVEIDELENSSESISPHAQRYFFFQNPNLIFKYRTVRPLKLELENDCLAQIMNLILIFT